MLPPVSDSIKKSSGFSLSGGVRFILAIILLAIGAGMTTASAVDTIKERAADSPGATSATAAAPQSNQRLELLSFKCSKEYGFSKVTGEVKNISDKSMESVVAVGSFYAEDGTFVKTADAIIDYNPILPGQTSPFEVITTSNPEITKCKVAFKEFFGGTIPTKVPENS